MIPIMGDWAIYSQYTILAPYAVMPARLLVSTQAWATSCASTGTQQCKKRLRHGTTMWVTVCGNARPSVPCQQGCAFGGRGRFPSNRSDAAHGDSFACSLKALTCLCADASEMGQ